jgi:GNAT superfamily N-acetyltransferase
MKDLMNTRSRFGASTMKSMVMSVISRPVVRMARKRILRCDCAVARAREDLEEYCRFKGITFGRGIIDEGFLNDRVLVTAKFSGRIIGHTMIGMLWKTQGIDATVSGMTWVHPLFRGLGIGSEMIGLSLDEAEQRGLLPVLGNIDEGNDHSLSMCQKMGFVIVDLPGISSVVEQYYRHRLGKFVRQIIVKFDPQASS